MNLSGTLADWTVADLLSMLKVTAKTATLHIRGARTGTIHFSEGRVVGAAIEGESLAGEAESRGAAADALFVLSRLDEGTFEIGPFAGAEVDGWDVEGVISDMEELRGLESDLVSAGLVGAPLMLKEDIDVAITIQPDDWWAVASLVSVLSFGQLEDVFGSGRATRLLHTLWQMSIIGVLSEPEPEVAEPPSAAESPAHIVEEDMEEADEVEAGVDAEVSVDAHDESWLDEIAAAAGGDPALEQERRRLTGVAAPASTVLTGSVLDEMRRLRSRPSE